MKLIGEGAEALIYAVRLYGADIIIKHRQPKRYRIRDLDSRIRRARTRKEARIMARAHENGITAPRLVGVGSTSIYMERISGVQLKDTRLTRSMASRAGALLGSLHNAGITHGDFTPANLMVGKGVMCIIDFGLSDMNTSSEERALDVLLMKRQISSQMYSWFAKSYLAAAKSGDETLKRLQEIEERGRYQSRTLS